MPAAGVARADLPPANALTLHNWCGQPSSRCRCAHGWSAYEAIPSDNCSKFYGWEGLQRSCFVQQPVAQLPGRPSDKQASLNQRVGSLLWEKAVFSIIMLAAINRHNSRPSARPVAEFCKGLSQNSARNQWTSLPPSLLVVRIMRQFVKAFGVERTQEWPAHAVLMSTTRRFDCPHFGQRTPSCTPLRVDFRS